MRCDHNENAGTDLARLPVSRAEAMSAAQWRSATFAVTRSANPGGHPPEPPEAGSDGKTAPVRRVAMKRVNHLGKVAA